MDFTHELITDEIKDMIRDSITTRSRLLGLVLIEVEGHPPVLVLQKDANDIIDKVPEEDTIQNIITFAGSKVEIKKEQIEEYLVWFSGAVFGALIKSAKKKECLVEQHIKLKQWCIIAVRRYSGSENIITEADKLFKWITE